MDDFYIYYVLEEENPNIGKINAIAPHAIKWLEDMSFIRVPAEYGLEFTSGRERMSNWGIQYDDESEDMVLAKTEVKTGTPFVSVFFQLPRTQKNPEMVITFKKKATCFHVQVPSVGLRKPKRKLYFFVTPLDDPNMSYFQFPVDFSLAAEPEGYEIPCPVLLPKQFSIFTNMVLDRYQMRIVR